MTTEELLQDLTDMAIKLKNSEGALNKIWILQEYPSCRTILKLVYDPQIKFNVTTEGLLNYRDNSDYEGQIIKDTLIEFFDNLSNLSGHKLYNYCLDFIYTYSKYETLILLLLDKKLKCGASVKTINKAWPKLIPEFNVPLAKKYEHGLYDFEKNDWYVSQKVDGIRCLAFIFMSGEIEFFSRHGKELFTLDKVKVTLKDSWKGCKGIILDGEIFKDSFKVISSEIRRKNHTIQKPEFLIFDYYTIQSFYLGEDYLDDHLNYDYYTKYLYLKRNLLETDTVKILPQTLIYSKDHFQEIFSKIPSNWEGLMLRKDEATDFKRSNNLLKVKRFQKDTFKVKDIKVSKKIINGEERTCCGSIEILYKGQVVSVGSGLSDLQRITWYNRPNLITNKKIIVKYFSESFDKNGKVSLLFPTLYEVL